ncbi:hypothetical protein SESBI_15486 [Sesbania bispinosa]|nr:hypothetical protein SESBI_15486 [Sesbania bispinosa]
MGIFVHDALDWIVTPKLQPDRPYLVIAFNLTHESFKEVEVPVTVHRNLDLNLESNGDQEV